MYIFTIKNIYLFLNVLMCMHGLHVSVWIYITYTQT